jgi:hypothetical protein
MPIKEIIAGIDAEIARLQQARELLNGTTSKDPAAAPEKKKRHISATGLAKIAAAQKKRWAKAKKAAK